MQRTQTTKFNHESPERICRHYWAAQYQSTFYHPQNIDRNNEFGVVMLKVCKPHPLHWFSSYAPINIIPHYPPYGTQVGIGGDYSRFARELWPEGWGIWPICAMRLWRVLACSLWENQKEAEWLPSLEEGKNWCLQRGGNLLSYFWK